MDYKYFETVSKHSNGRDETTLYSGQSLEEALAVYDNRDPFDEVRMFREPIYDSNGEFISNNYNYDLYEDFKERLIKYLEQYPFCHDYELSPEEERAEAIETAKAMTEEAAEKALRKLL